MQFTTQRKKIVVLGGGCGGVVAATQLGRKLGADHDVILVDRRPDHIFMPAFLFVMLGERQPRDISRSLRLLEKRNVKVIQSEIPRYRSVAPRGCPRQRKDRLRLFNCFPGLADAA